MKLRNFIITAALVSLLLISSETFAQCAMCKAAAEEGVKDGNTQSATLNSGIMYLLAMPYLAFAVIGYLWWKNYKRKKATDGDF